MGEGVVEGMWESGCMVDGWADRRGRNTDSVRSD